MVLRRWKEEMMKCPYCGSGNIHVKDSRHRDGFVYRRRECNDCGKEFSTHEKIVTNLKMSMREDWDCPTEDCDECEHQRSVSWCSKAIPNHEKIDEEYKIRKEEFFKGFHAAEEHYKTIVEVLDEMDEKFVKGEYVEPIHCGECVYFADWIGISGDVTDHYCTRPNQQSMGLRATDWCSFAKRKGEDDESMESV